MRSFMLLILFKPFLSSSGTKAACAMPRFRDPADWLWSSWNFFDQQKHLDAEGLGRNGWVKRNYRSPELFHELTLDPSR